MSPAIIAGIISLVEELVTESPAIYAELQTIFAKSNPTPVDWELLRTKIVSDSFAKLAPDVKLS
jgi:hypothetical protein